MNYSNDADEAGGVSKLTHAFHNNIEWLDLPYVMTTTEARLYIPNLSPHPTAQERDEE